MSSLKGIGRLVPLAILALSAACERLTGHAVRDWSQDVALDDGRTIVIDRHVEFDSSNSMAGDAYSVRETRSTISFRGDLATLPKWDFDLRPLVLYQDSVTSEWVVVATTTNCDTWRAWYEPPLAYWEFRLSGPAWSERYPLFEASFGRLTNLFTGYESGVPSKHVTTALTRQYTDHAGIDRDYRSIRQDAGTNCSKDTNPKTRN